MRKPSRSSSNGRQPRPGAGEHAEALETAEEQRVERRLHGDDQRLADLAGPDHHRAADQRVQPAGAGGRDGQARAAPSGDSRGGRRGRRRPSDAAQPRQPKRGPASPRPSPCWCRRSRPRRWHGTCPRRRAQPRRRVPAQRRSAGPGAHARGPRCAGPRGALARSRRSRRIPSAQPSARSQPAARGAVGREVLGPSGHGALRRPGGCRQVAVHATALAARAGAAAVTSRS